jgi:hypothetical protein
MSGETPVMTMLDTIRQTIKQAEADGTPDVEKWSVLGTLIDQAGSSNPRTNASDNEASGSGTSDRNGTPDAESVDIDELESHGDHAETNDVVVSPTSRLVTVTPSDSLVAPEIIVSVSSRTTSFTPKKTKHPSDQSPARSASPVSPQSLRELEKQREKQAKAESKAARKLEKAAWRRVEGEQSKPRPFDSTGRRNTPTMDVTTPEEPLERRVTPSEEALPLKEKQTEPAHKPKSEGVDACAPTEPPAQRISPRSVVKAASAATALERSTPDRSTPASDDSPRQTSRLAQVIAAKRAGSTNLKVDTTRTEATSPDTPMSVDEAEVTNGWCRFQPVSIQT